MMTQKVEKMPFSKGDVVLYEGQRMIITSVSQTETVVKISWFKEKQVTTYVTAFASPFGVSKVVHSPATNFVLADD